MDISDLGKDVRRVLLNHWTEREINSRLEDPVYFFEQVVNPHLEFVRRQGERTPLVRIKRDPKGDLVILLRP